MPSANDICPEPIMKALTQSSINPARALLAGVWGILCLSAIAAPVLAAHAHHSAAAVFYLIFSRVCHQIPERSFMVSAYALAVCHRCAGIYLGLFLGALAGNLFIHRSPRTRRIWVLAAIIPLWLDALLPYTGLWSSTDISRFLTGMLFGVIASSLLVRGLTELLQEVSWRRFSIRDPHFKGGIL
jgi:uncharacterized membrane protein